MATADTIGWCIFSALSRGERADAQRPGEGVRTIHRLQPLTPALSPWERERGMRFNALPTAFTTL